MNRDRETNLKGGEKKISGVCMERMKSKQHKEDTN